MAKPGRQQAILELVQAGPIASQQDLQHVLAKRGFKVGQATLSRDIRALALVKTPAGYAVGSGSSNELALPPVSRLVREFVLEVKSAQNLLVVKTCVGSAQPVAAALDSEGWPEVVGTIAGDDSILIVSPSKKTAAKLAHRIQEMLH
jgi:transcriptional regulator of arginine metabolism